MIEDNDIGGPPSLQGREASRGHADGALAETARSGRSGDDAAAATRVAEDDADARRPNPATGTMTISFKLYATLQDLLPAGAVKNAVPIEVATDVTLNEIIDRHKVPRELAHLVLVNGVFVCDTDRDARGTLKAGDVLAIWPPVAGG